MNEANRPRRIAYEYLENYPETDPDAVELNYLMSAAADAMRAASEQLFSRFGTDQQRRAFGLVRVLYFSADQAMSQTELSERLNLSPSTVTYFIDALERDGLVVRMPHASDRRMTLVAITSSGRSLCQEIVPAVAHHMARVASVFTKQEKRTFSELLLRFKASAESSLSAEDD